MQLAATTFLTTSSFFFFSFFGRQEGLAESGTAKTFVWIVPNAPLLIVISQLGALR
jgi:hypothetical protein